MGQRREIPIDITLSTDKAEREARQLAHEVGRVGTEGQKASNAAGNGMRRLADQTESARAKVSRLATSFSTFVGLVASYLAMKFTANLIEVNKQFAKMRATLITVTGSQAAANEEFERLQKFAATMPVSLREVTQSFLRLKAMGLDASIDSLTSYANTAAAMGKSMIQMVEAVADAVTGEFERLKEFGIRAKTQGDQVTFTFRGVSTTVKKTAEDIQNYLLQIGKTDFFGAAEKQAKTFAGAISNLGDAWDKLLDKFLQGELEQLISRLIRLVSWVLEKVGELFDWLNDRLTDLHQTLHEIFPSLVGPVEHVSQALATHADQLNAVTDVTDKAADATKRFTDALSEQASVLKDEYAGLTYLVNHMLQLRKGLQPLNKELEYHQSVVSNAVKLYQQGAITQEHFLSILQKEQPVIAGLSKAVEQQKDLIEKQRKPIEHIYNLHLKTANATKKHTSAVKQHHKAVDDAAKTYNQLIDALKTEIIRLKEGEEAALRYALAKKKLSKEQIDEIVQLQKVKEQLEQNAEAQRRLEEISRRSAEQQQKVYERLAERLENTFTDMWQRLFEGTMKFGDMIKGWFYKLLAELAHAAITRPIVLSLGVGLSGTAQAGGLFGSGNSTLSAIGNVLSNPSSILMTLGAASNFSAALFSGAGAEQAAMLAAQTAEFGMAGATATASALGSSSIGATLAAAAPYLLPFILFAIGSGLFKDKEASTKFIADFSAPNLANPRWYAVDQGIYNWRKSSTPKAAAVDTPFGWLKVGIQHTGKEGQLSNEKAGEIIAQMTAFFKRVKQLDDSLIKSFALSENQVKEIQKQIESLSGKTSETKLNVEYLIAERYKAVFGEIGGWAKTLFDSFASQKIKAEELVNGAQAILQINESLKNLGDISAKTAKILQDQNRRLTETYKRQVDAVQNLLLGFDGTVQATLELSQGLQGMEQAAFALVSAIQKARDEMSRMYESSRERIETWKRDNEWLYKYYSQRYTTATAALQHASSYEDVIRYSKEANQYLTKLFSIQTAEKGLSNNQIEAIRQDFLKQNEALDQLTQQKLAEFEQAAANTAKQIGDAVRNALSQPAATMQDAATGMQAAAGGLQSALNNIHVTVAVQQETLGGLEIG